jgi:hypothetical protein
MLQRRCYGGICFARKLGRRKNQAVICRIDLRSKVGNFLRCSVKWWPGNVLFQVCRIKVNRRRLVVDDLRLIYQFCVSRLFARRYAWRQVTGMNEGVDVVFDFIRRNKESELR